MGEKKGAIFNIIVVVVITGLIIFAMRKLVPVLLDKIGAGATTMVEEGFKSAVYTPGG